MEDKERVNRAAEILLVLEDADDDGLNTLALTAAVYCDSRWR